MLFLASLILAAAQPVAAPPPRPLDAATIAGGIQARLPQRFSADVSLVAAAAERDTIVLTFEVAEPVLVGATPDAVSQRFSYGFCNAPGGAALLSGPLSLRIDARTAAGRVVQGAVLDTCPATLAPLPPPR